MRARMETYLAPVVAGLLALVTLIGLIGPAISSPAPHDIPIGIVNANPQMVTALSGSGAFDVTSYDSENAARAAIDSRDIDGALVIGPSGPKLIVAGAAGDGVTGVITGVFTQMFIGLSTRLSIVVLFAIVSAPVAMGIATWIAGDYGSGIWMAIAFLALGSAAIGTVVAGAAALLGRPGIALSALIVVLLDLVCSGGPIGSQLLPDAYRWLAPGMPAGQLYSAVRGTLYFDNAGITVPFGVLSLWLLGGLILMVGGQLVARRSVAAAPSVSGEPAVHGADR